MVNAARLLFTGNKVEKVRLKRQLVRCFKYRGSLALPFFVRLMVNDVDTTLSGEKWIASFGIGEGRSNDKSSISDENEDLHIKSIVINLIEMCVNRAMFASLTKNCKIFWKSY
jgi:hypothetical protein